MKSLEQLMAEHFEFTSTTFPEATGLSSLTKLQEEIGEVSDELIHGSDSEALAVEFADCFQCLNDSMGRAGVTVPMLVAAFAKKLEVNKARTWVKNPDNTYSHVKSPK